VEADEKVADDGPLAMLASIRIVLRRNRVAMAVWMMACIVAAALYAWSQPPSYWAAAQLLLEPRRTASISARDVQAAPSLDLNRADSELQVIRSERLLSEVFTSLELAEDPELQATPRRPLFGWLAAYWPSALGPVAPEPPEGDEEALRAPVGPPEAALTRQSQMAFLSFASRLSARRVGQSYVIEISYTSSDPERAARVANAAVSAYLKQSVAFKAEAAKSGGEFIQGRVDALLGQVAAAEKAKLAGFVPQVPTPDADARVIGAALAPLAPTAPQKTLIVGFGGLMGLLTALFAAAVSSALDRKVRTPQRLMRESGLSSLANLPKVRTLGGLAHPPAQEMQQLVTTDPNGAFAEALQDLRSAIRLAVPTARADRYRIIAVTSPRRDAGCSTVAMNLAHLIKRSGGTPTVIDADVRGGQARGAKGSRQKLRKRAAALSSRFAYGKSALVDVLLGTAKLDQLVVINVGGVALVPVRSVEPLANMAVDFADPRFAQILEIARARGDVIIDLPPVLEGSDARMIARQADAVVLVVSAERSTLEEAAEAGRLLRLAGASIAGAVVNHAL
jgi:Mrp family chromosome partitioning ATPase/capsular polysaccharide biosynthesis protein